MNRSEPAGNPAIQLETRRQIDAICDRFELAWNERQPPRIEDYLELLPSTARPQLLAELLASELALRGEGAGQPSEYRGRFPQFGEVITDVFRHLPKTAHQSGPSVDFYCQSIRELRSRWRADPLTTAIHDADRTLRQLAGRLASGGPDEAAAGEAVNEEQLWRALFRACRAEGLPSVEQVHALIRELLEPFSPLRRSILINVLLGQTGSQVSGANGVTERTVATTVASATRLLRAAAAGGRWGQEASPSNRVPD